MRARSCQRRRPPNSDKGAVPLPPQPQAAPGSQPRHPPQRRRHSPALHVAEQQLQRSRLRGSSSASHCRPCAGQSARVAKPAPWPWRCCASLGRLPGELRSAGRGRRALCCKAAFERGLAPVRGGRWTRGGGTGRGFEMSACDRPGAVTGASAQARGWLTGLVQGLGVAGVVVARRGGPSARVPPRRLRRKHPLCVDRRPAARSGDSSRRDYASAVGRQSRAPSA